MTDYKQALDKAVEYIIDEGIGGMKCINAHTCTEYFHDLIQQGIEYSQDRNICKDSIRQQFLREAEDEND